MAVETTGTEKPIAFTTRALCAIDDCSNDVLFVITGFAWSVACISNVLNQDLGGSLTSLGAALIASRNYNRYMDQQELQE